ncbi:hypothetical protein Y032_0753g2073 [Ancylostoma ceylanicum]|uniref:Chitin-binding type-2 domain-containing protein n=1 Tax=Ancylostoma ceylanicum TaxID=53326 RepID=A0A016WEC1_9BILA|nr:hypothetical protein Y032_0753g2073 [Ancylostoma ceylanicum]
MLLPLLVLARIPRFSACIATQPPSGPGTATEPPSGPGEERCTCPRNLYSLTLCPQMRNCFPDAAGAVTYDFGQRCLATLNCPVDYQVRFMLANGNHLNNIEVRSFVMAQYRMECTKQTQQWLLYGPPLPQGQAFTQLACYDTPIVNMFAKRAISVAHGVATCKTCSPPPGIPADNCPQSYECSSPIIGTKTDATSSCKYSVVECPGSNLLVQLKSGTSTVIYPEDARCHEQWTFYDDQHTHQIESMTCLSKAPEQNHASNCSCSYPAPRQICMSPTACGDVVPGKSLNDCTSKLHCSEGNHLFIRKRQEVCTV